LLYSGLFVVAGAALLSVNYALVRHRELKKGTSVSIVCKGNVGMAQVPAPSATSNALSTVFPGCSGIGVGGTDTTPGVVRSTGQIPQVQIGPQPGSPDAAAAQFAGLQHLAQQAQDHTLHTLEVESGLALGLMAFVSLGLGWLVAGRVLRPLHRITNTARRLSQETLHERINLDGPNDELKELADTFDAMLARLDQAFSSQRRFVANASHELRTPLATERVLIDEALANRRASPEELRSILEQLRVNTEESETLINALLVLASSERGVDRWIPTDLAALAAQVVEQTRAEAVTEGVTIRTDLQAAPTTGDPALLERLVGNLVENAVRHNLPTNGWVEVRTGTRHGRTTLLVANSGPVLAADHVPALFEPFRREGTERTATNGGFGLGLSIVQSVIRAHHARLDALAPEAGGLEITVSLPASDAKPVPDTGRVGTKLGH
jgi:signal transduction histidine kinase